MTTTTNPVHYPANPDKFEFDADVARIFPNMAKRSIPDYERFHELHARITARMYGHDGARLLDVGASHGAFFQFLFRHYWNTTSHVPRFNLTAVDSSPAMCENLRIFFPQAKVICGDITSFAVSDELECMGQFDVINATYVLQFVPPRRQPQVLAQLAALLKDGGILILGQKDHIPETPLGLALNGEYLKFRQDNGYSAEEIVAKTKALKNSMWPMDFEELVDMLNCSFREVYPTTRTLMFNTLIAYK